MTGRPTRILGVVASPHEGGSTVSAVRELLEGARQAGADVTLLDLVAGDAAEAVSAIEFADAVAFGSPTYRASNTALLAGLLEKVERGQQYESSAPLRGKATAIVMTGAAEQHFLATEGLRTKLSTFFAVQVLSPSLFLSRDAFGPDKQPTNAARDLLRLHGRALLELADATRTGRALSQLAPLV